MRDPHRVRRIAVAVAAAAALVVSAAPSSAADRIPVVVDLDIGDDIDDSFALAWLLASPEFEVRGISTAWGDTALRVRLVQRLLRETGRGDIPVLAGLPTDSKASFSQARWASGPHGVSSPASAASVPKSVPASARLPTSAPTPGASIDFLLQQAKRDPGRISLLALGPLTNLAAAARRDPQGFRSFKQVVMMGGSVRAGYGGSDYRPAHPPDREYNIAADVAAARTVFAAGVRIVMMPLDATALRLDDQKRAALFSHGSALTDALTLMVQQWTHADQPWVSATPTLFDVVPVGYLLQPSLCPTVALRIEIDDDGLTRETAGPPNAEVCLASDKAALLDRLMRALLAWPVIR